MLPKTSFFVSAPSLFLGVVDAVIETFSEKQKIRFEACILFAASDIAAFFVSSRVADSRLLSDRTQNAKKILCLCRRRQKCIFVLLQERPQFLSLLFRLGKLSGSEIGKAHGDQTSITFGCTFFCHHHRIIVETRYLNTHFSIRTSRKEGKKPTAKRGLKELSWE